MVDVWLNQDPIGERGFTLLRTRSSKLLGLVGMFRQFGGNNVYEFVGNQPTDFYDALGLAPGSPTGPGTSACISALEQLSAAVALAAAEPSIENNALVSALAWAADQACKPPPPPPPPPSWCPAPRWVPPYIPPPTPQQQCFLAVSGGAIVTVCVIIILAPVGM